MATPTKFNSVVTNPGGTGSTITPTLSTHASGDILEIFVTKTGNAAWSAPAGWSIRHQTSSPGTASTATVGTLLYRRVLPGDTLPLASPVCNLAATVTRHAICRTIRGADVEGVYILPEWAATATTSGTSNPIRPPSVTTPAPEMLVTHYYCQRVATNAPEPTGYTQDQQVITSGTLVTNISEKNVADQQTALTNQDASPTSGGRWVGMISCAPSPDYVYYRAGSQAFNSNAPNVAPTLPTGTLSSDNRSNQELIIMTAQCAGATPTPNTPGDWTEIPSSSLTTGGGGSTVRKWWALYNGTLDRQVNRSGSGEILVYLSTYRNPDQATPIGNHNAQSNNSSTSGTWPQLERVATKSTIQLTCVADATPTYTTPATWTERNDSQGTVCADQVFDAITTISSSSFTLNNSSPTVGAIVEIRGVSSVSIELTLSLSDSIDNWADTSQLLLSLSLALADELALTDAVTYQSDQGQPLSDSISLTDDIVLQLDYHAELSDVLSALSDAVESQVGVTLTLADDCNTLTSAGQFLLTHELKLADVNQTFPSTVILDNFNRPNEGPPPSANWTTGIAEGLEGYTEPGFDVIDNELANSFSDFQQNYWNVEQFGPDCEAYITVKNTQELATISFVLRLTNVGQFTSNGYVAKITTTEEVGGGFRLRYTIYRLDAGEVTGLDTTLTIIPGDITGKSFGMRVTGSTIQVLADLGSGWEVKLTATDSTYTTAGFIGLVSNGGPNSRLDDFGGGTLVEGLSDAFAHELDTGPSLALDLADVLTLADTVALGHGLLPVDTLTLLTDAVVARGAGDLSVADTLSLTDAESHTLELQLAFAEIFSLADSLVLDGGLLFSGLLTLTDSSSLQLDHLLSASDTLSIVDSESHVLAHLIALVDSVDFLVDSTALQLSQAVDLADSIPGLIDTLTLNLDHQLFLNDLIVLADAYSQLADSLLTFTDSLSLTDSLQLDYGLLLTEDINLLIDSIETSAPQGPLQQVGVTDAIDLISDEVALELGYLLDIADDAATLNDASILLEDLRSSFGDSFSLTDALASTLNHFTPLADTLVFSDAIRLELSHELALDDAVILSDAIAPNLNHLLTPTDNVALLADLAAFSYGFSLIISDNGPTLTESIEFFSAWQLQPSDMLALTDSLAKFSAGFLPLADSLAITDSVVIELRGPDLDATVSDSLTLDDAISLSLGNELQLQLTLTDTITLSDHYFDLRHPYTPSAKRHIVVPSRARLTVPIKQERGVLVPARDRMTRVE